MASYIEYANSKATRNRKLSPKLVNAMSFLGSMGVTMRVVSGGQAGKGEKGGRVGSTRHDHGNAADADFYMNGRRLVWSKPQDRAVLAEIVTNAARNGVTGIGAGDNYMGDGRIHVGFGSAATWGGGKGVSAPAWLRQAYVKGRATKNKSTSSGSSSNFQQPQLERPPLIDMSGFSAAQFERPPLIDMSGFNAEPSAFERPALINMADIQTSDNDSDVNPSTFERPKLLNMADLQANDVDINPSDFERPPLITMVGAQDDLIEPDINPTAFERPPLVNMSDLSGYDQQDNPLQEFEPQG